MNSSYNSNKRTLVYVCIPTYTLYLSLFAMHRFADLRVHKSIHIQELAILILFPNSFNLMILEIKQTYCSHNFRYQYNYLVLTQRMTEFTVVVEHHFEKEFSLMADQKNGNHFLLVLCKCSVVYSSGW